MNFLSLLIVAALTFTDAKPQGKQPKQQHYAARYPRIGRMMVDRRQDVPDFRQAKEEQVAAGRPGPTRQVTETVTVPIRTITQTETSTNTVETTTTLIENVTDWVTQSLTRTNTIWGTIDASTVETVTETVEDNSPRYTTITQTNTLTLDPTTITENETVTVQRTTFINQEVIATTDITSTLIVPTTDTAYHIVTVVQTLFGETQTETTFETVIKTTTELVNSEQTIWVTETEFTSTQTNTITSTLTM